MNAELLGLLRAAGVPGRIDWRNVLVLYNYAPIPPALLHCDPALRNRGFNLVILNAGQPTYFVKCRPSGDPVLEWETTIRTALAGDRPGGVSVASVCMASSDRLMVQVGPFLRGSHYGRIVVRQSTATYIDTLRRVLVGAADLATVALQECTRVRASEPTILLSATSGEMLATVARLASLAEPEYAALAGALAQVGDVPARPQHGDLWWQNLYIVDGQPWLIDFDSYGDVQVALYDDLTLILTTIGLRAGGHVAGLDRLASSHEDGRACRALLSDRASTEGLCASQLDGLLVNYLVTMAATVHRRGGVGFAAPHIAAARRAAERLAAGGKLLTPS